MTHFLYIAVLFCLFQAALSLSTGVLHAVSEQLWDSQWKNGSWGYMDAVPIERMRLSVIGSVLIPMYVGVKASVLDIGCGAGAILDFLPEGNRHLYTGVDLSQEAINIAQRTRGNNHRFIHASATDFQPHHKFDVIIFSELLYYVDFEKILLKYRSFVKPDGFIIISLFSQTNMKSYDSIWKFARETFVKVDDVDMEGNLKKSAAHASIRTKFHIEVYRAHT